MTRRTEDMAAAVPPGPPPYVPVIGDIIVPDGINEANSMVQILHWIGFTVENTRNHLIRESFESYGDVKVMTEKDVSALVTDFANRNQANGRVHIGSRKAKRLKGLLHWVQDFYRVSREPSIVGLNEESFLEALENAIERAQVRKSMKDASDTTTKAADPGPLKSEKEWKEWEEKFTNLLNCIMGVSGVPLSYVIRDDENPDHDGDHPNFINETIACAPLGGEYYRADSLAVHNLIISYTTGQPSGDWIKDVIRHSNGRRSMKALRDHFGGEGNASRNKAIADRLKESLHYKSERAMPFENFLTQIKKMFNIYEKEDEPMAEDAKVRFLFKRVQHSGLQAAIEALKAQQIAGTVVTYTMAANHLSTAVSELPEYLNKNRTIAALGSENKGRKGSAILYNEDGSVKTGFIPGWHKISRSDKDIVITERKRQGIKPGNKTWKRDKDKSATTASDSNRLKQLEEQNKIYKRKIKALKRGHSNNQDDEVDLSDDNIDAADQFGGKASKQKKSQHN